MELGRVMGWDEWGAGMTREYTLIYIIKEETFSIIYIFYPR